jgi:hypothetical protein
MAHVTLHFSIGMLIGLLCMGRLLLGAWRGGRPLAGLCARTILLALALGVYASIPSLLRRLGVPDAVCDGWWMNVFLGYPLIKSIFTCGGMPLGGLAVTAAFGAPYLFLLVAMRRARCYTSKSPTRNV